MLAALRTLAAGALLAAACLAAHGADPGVLPGRIVLGMSAPLTGALSPYALALEKGLKLGFAQANAAGGVGGRQIELLVRDDAGRADLAVANTQALIDTGVLAFTGYHGPAAIEAALPLIERSGALLIGAASSAEVLREPARRQVFNLRAAAREESAAMVLQLDTVGLTEIAAIAQDDALGRAALEGVQVELSRLAIRPQALVRVATEPSAAAVAQAVQEACKGRPQALVLGLGAGNALAVIRSARKAGCAPQFYVMSEAGAQLLGGVAAAGELAGVIVSQVMPHPRTGALPVVSDYQRLAGDGASYPGLEGFVYARVITEALRRCAREPSRHCMTAAFEARAIDVGGYRVQFSPGERRGSRMVEMTIVTADGRFRR